MNVLSQYRIALYLALLFLAGVITGVSLSWSLVKKNELKPAPGDLSPRIQHRLQSQLSLSPEQMEKTRLAVEDAVKSLEAIHQQSMPQIDLVFRKLNEELAKNLTPEQQLKLQELERKRLASREKDHSPTNERHRH